MGQEKIENSHEKRVMPEESIIDQCRHRFTGGSRGLLGFFKKSRPAWERDCAQDEISPDAEPHYRILLQHGRVVWGCIAQSNAGLFGIGTTNLPANTIFSNDPFYDLNPGALEAVAMAIYSLKDSVPEDPQLRQIAATITDERNYALNLPVPKVLTLGRDVLFTTTVIRRKRLPSGYLAARLLPLVICPER